MTPRPPGTPLSDGEADLIALLESVTRLGFSARVRHSGGRQSAAGRELQDQYGAAQSARLFRRDDERAIRVVVERAGDIDVLAITSAGTLREEYHQVKSRGESLARWSVAELRTEGVWREFVAILSDTGERAPRGREVRVVFATDGELSEELTHLRRYPALYRTGVAAPDAKDTKRRRVLRGELLAALAGGLLTPAEELTVRKAVGVKKWTSLTIGICDALDRAPEWVSVDPDARIIAAPLPTEAVDVLQTVAPKLNALARRVQDAIERAARHLDYLLRSLHLVSRLGVPSILDAAAPRPISDPLPPGVLASVVQLDLARHLALDVASAEDVYKRLRDAIDDATLSGAEFTETLLRQRLDVKDPPPRDASPPPVADGIERADLRDAIRSALARDNAVWIVGAPKVGKTEVVRQSLEPRPGEGQTVSVPVVWLRPAGAGDDVSYFWLQVAAAVAEVTGNREWYAAMLRGGVEPTVLRGRLLRVAAERGLVIVLDAADTLGAAERAGALGLLGDARTAGVKVIGVAWASATLNANAVPTLADVPVVPVDGLTPREAVTLWRTLGKHLTEAAEVALVGLSFRVGGHPVVLRLGASNCGVAPTAEEIRQIADALPGGGAEHVIGQIADQLFRHFALETPTGALLPRIALLGHGVDEAQARAIAAASDPPLPWSALGWARLASSVLEPAGRNRYRIPAVYREVAQLEAHHDPALQARVRRAAAGVLLANAVSTAGTGAGLTIHWADARDAMMDFVLARAWGEAAYPAFLLVRAFFGSEAPSVVDDERRAVADDLWLTLVAFRVPEALEGDIPADVHAMILDGLARLEMLRHPDELLHEDTLGALRALARGPGPAGERAAIVTAVTLGERALHRGDFEAAATELEPVWRRAVERREVEIVRMLGGLRVGALAAHGSAPHAVLDQLDALAFCGAPATSAHALLGESAGHDPSGTLALAYLRPISARPDHPIAELAALYEGHLEAFRAASLLDGVVAVGAVLALLLFDLGQSKRAEELSIALVTSSRGGGGAEVRALAARGDFLRVTHDVVEAVAAYAEAAAVASHTSPDDRLFVRTTHVNALREAGRLHAAHGEASSAVRAMQRAYGLVALDPTVPPAERFTRLGEVAVALYRAGRPLDAAACTEALLTTALQAMRPTSGEGAAPHDAMSRLFRLVSFAQHLKGRLTAAGKTNGASAATLALDVLSTPLASHPEGPHSNAVPVLAGTVVADLLFAVGRARASQRVAMRALDGCRPLALRDGPSAHTFALLLLHQVRAAATAHGGARAAMAVLADAHMRFRVTVLLAGHDWRRGDELFLDHYLLAALDALEGVPPETARVEVAALDAWARVAVGCESLDSYRVACELARAHAALRDGARVATEALLDAASAVAEKPLAQVSLHLGRARLLDVLFPSSSDVTSLVESQLGYAQEVAALEATSSWFGRTLRHDLIRFWTLISPEQEATDLAAITARTVLAPPTPASFVAAAGRLLAAAEAISLPLGRESVLAAWILDEDCSALSVSDAMAVLVRYARSALALLESNALDDTVASDMQAALETRINTCWTELRLRMAPDQGIQLEETLAELGINFAPD
jgi:hypothetical protein